MKTDKREQAKKMPNGLAKAKRANKVRRLRDEIESLRKLVARKDTKLQRVRVLAQRMMDEATFKDRLETFTKIRDELQSP